MWCVQLGRAYDFALNGQMVMRHLTADPGGFVLPPRCIRPGCAGFRSISCTHASLKRWRCIHARIGLFASAGRGVEGTRMVSNILGRPLAETRAYCRL